MTAAAQRGGARRPAVTAAVAGGQACRGLLEKLVAAVRPEFRVDVYVPATDDPVLGTGLCAARGCGASARTRRLCTGHYFRWRAAGFPDMEAFTASPGAGLAGQCEPEGCVIEGCRYGTRGRGLCERHAQQWSRSGCPDLAAWAATVPPVSGQGRRECGLPFCRLWAQPAASPFCHAHTARWRSHGRPDPAGFIAGCELAGRAHIDYRGLVPQLKLELQYAVQCRRDDATVKTMPHDVMAAIRRLTSTGISSLLEWQAPRTGRRASGSGGDTPGAFLAYAKDAAESLLHGSGWDTEYPREVWRLDKLAGVTASPNPSTRHRRQMRFDRISQPWLKDIARRWCRLRLSAGLSSDTVLADVRALTLFSQFLQTVPHACSLAVVDRPLLERYIAWLAPRPGRVPGNAIGTLNTLFTAIRQHGWDLGLPATAMFFPSDIPPRRSQADRHLAGHIMIQVEQPANLDRWPCPEGRLITLILVRAGLRASDACALAFGCLLHDGQGAPYLRYYNHKMRREAAVPIDEELQAEIQAQQQRVSHRWPAGTPYLFPRLTSNAGGQRPFTYGAYWGMLKRWLISCDIRDEHGRPVQLTPHQWRHTFATRLINRDVPQEVVRVLLDHDSSAMTAHYAKITDQTVRRHWEQATKVNIKGERVTISPDGPLAQAQWAKTRYGMATQTLPNGYCGLPIQKSCPHANACLTCPVFLTGTEFLPQLRQQRHQTLTLISGARKHGHERVAEMNKQVLANLDRMIGEIGNHGGEDGDAR